MTTLIRFQQNIFNTPDYLNPTHLRAVLFSDDEGFAILEMSGGQSYTTTCEEARRIIAAINETPAAPLAAGNGFTLPPKHTTAEIVSMTRDETKNSRSPFWRCGTKAGFMVNVFQHDDPLKNNFSLFEEAGFGPEMSAMSYGDNITWTRDSITVELEENGKFWNVVRVLKRDGEMPDESEDDTPAEVDPIHFD